MNDDNKLFEASRPTALPDIALAKEGIERMRAGQSDVTGDHIRAIVALAECGADQLAQFDIRWAADMRAINRWKAGDAMTAQTRALLESAAAALRRDPGDDPAARVATVEAARLAEAIDQHLAESRPGARPLVWPDHSDLVVWLMALIESPTGVPHITAILAQQEALASAARGGVIVPATIALVGRAKATIDQLLGYLRKAEMRALAAEEGLRLAHAHLSPERIEAVLDQQLSAQLAEAYDCTRVWEAWGIGTMSADDFEPVTERLAEIIPPLVEAICGIRPAQPRAETVQ